MCSMSRQILSLLWKIKCKFCLDISTVNPVYLWTQHCPLTLGYSVMILLPSSLLSRNLVIYVIFLPMYVS